MRAGRGKRPGLPAPCRFKGRTKPGMIKNRILFFKKICTVPNLVYLCNPNQKRELSSVGSERLPYKQRVGGSTPSAPTTRKGEPKRVTQKRFCVTLKRLSSKDWPHPNPLHPLLGGSRTYPVRSLRDLLRLLGHPLLVLCPRPEAWGNEVMILCFITGPDQEWS